MPHSSWMPAARRQGIITQHLEGQLVLYDTRSHHAYCLTDEAATVFKLCDGTRTLDLLARAALPVARSTVLQVVDELASLDLFTADARLLRRQVLAAPLVGGTFVASMLVPRAAAAASCVGILGSCGTRSCCPGLTCILNALHLPVCA
jgi:hypothetical protein